MRGPDQISSDSWWNFRLRVLVVSAFWRTAALQRLNRTGENVIATQTPVRTPLTKRAGRRCAGHEEKAELVVARCAASTFLSGRIFAAGSVASPACTRDDRSEEHTSELQSRLHLVCRLLLEKKKTTPASEHTGTGL